METIEGLTYLYENRHVHLLIGIMFYIVPVLAVLSVTELLYVIWCQRTSTREMATRVVTERPKQTYSWDNQLP